MEDLISLGETLQQASAALGGDDVPDETKANASPVINIVVLGAPGAGKSAVLNTLIGHAVLPTAEGGATRFPVLIDLQRDVNLRAGSVRGNLGQRVNMAKPAEVRQALQSDMNQAKSSSRSRSRQEAHLILRSPSAPPMRIADLPGVEKASDLDGTLQDNVSNQDAIILVVVSATAVKDSLKLIRMAHDIDRDGARTIGVLTKFDKVATDKSAAKLAVELLQGQGSAMAQDYPWVAVIGQPLDDKDSNQPMDEAWQGELKVLSAVLRANGAKGMEGSTGRDALLKTMARTVRKKMKEKIPRIMTGLEARSQDVESELLRLGESLISDLQGGRAVALELCRGFETKFCEHLDGSEGGGSQMVEKFVGTLPLRFRGLPLDDMFSFENVKKVVAVADGYQPYLMSPEKGLRLLIKRSLELAKQPGLDCVDEVHKILLDIVVAAASTAPSLVRFPPMKKELVSIASAALDQYRAEAKIVVTALVDMERVFIPATHFIEAEYKRQDALFKELQMARKNMHMQGGRMSGEGRFGSFMSNMGGRKKEPPPPPPNAAAAAAVQISQAQPMQELAGFLMKVSSKGGWSKRWFALSDKTARLYYVKKPDEKTPRGVIPLEDCLVEEIVPPEEFPAITDSKATNPPPQSLVFKISNRTPYKTVVKVHHHLILRADNLAEKQQWVARLRMHTKAFKEAPPPAAAAAAAADGDADGAGEQQQEDGERGDNEQSGLVPPAPGQGGQGQSGLSRQSNPEEDLKHMVGEVRRYVHLVLAHLADNIPKAIVLSQVEKAKDAMLTKLYQKVSELSDDSLSALLQEDVESKSKRERFKHLQEALLKLKRSLSLHEARASAEEDSSGEKDKVDDWRMAFNKASPMASVTEDDTPSSSSSSSLPASTSPLPSPSKPNRTSSGPSSAVAKAAAAAAAAAGASPSPANPEPTRSPAPGASISGTPGAYSSSSASPTPPSYNARTSNSVSGAGSGSMGMGMGMGGAPMSGGGGGGGQMMHSASNPSLVGGGGMRGPPMGGAPMGAPPMGGPPMAAAASARNPSPLRQMLSGAGLDMNNPMRARRMPPPPPTTVAPTYKFQ